MLIIKFTACNLQYYNLIQKYTCVDTGQKGRKQTKIYKTITCIHVSQFWCIRRLCYQHNGPNSCQPCFQTGLNKDTIFGSCFLLSSESITSFILTS